MEAMAQTMEVLIEITLTDSAVIGESDQRRAGAALAAFENMSTLLVNIGEFDSSQTGTSGKPSNSTDDRVRSPRNVPVQTD